MKTWPLQFALAAICAVLPLIAQNDPAGNGTNALDTTVRINQIQLIGTHNSYHAGLSSAEAATLRERSPRTAEALDYHHPPLERQLDAGIRQIELDVFPDPAGGRYVRLESGAETSGQMRQPGFKVMHLQDLDQRSTCLTLRGCLAIVRHWSQQHPDHLPVFILIECKTARIAGAVEPYTSARLDALDAEIRTVFPKAATITPDDIRHQYANLLEAIHDNGWPSLAAARGKVIFLLDNRELAALYVEDHPALRGRILFPNEAPGNPNSAFTELNSGPTDTIRALVHEGYLVRTRADADTLEARRNSTARRDAAIASGAQLISTDYPASEPARWTGYAVSFAKGGLSRCNPANATPSCGDSIRK